MVIDGVKYVPAREVVVNSEMILRALIEWWWGDTSDKDVGWLEDSAKSLALFVTDSYTEDEYAHTVAEFVDSLAELQ